VIAALLLALAAAPSPSPPFEEGRVAVLIGSDTGDTREERLSYAEADAIRVRDLLVEIGGVDSERAALVLGGGADAARRALAEAVGRVLELKHRGTTSLVVYVSAHADEEALHLDGTHLPIAEIRTLLDGSGADLRVLVIDACRSAVVVREKGGAPGPDIAIAADRRANVAGDVMITASGLGEPAQEWSYLRGSLFTHHLLAGLRGPGDADGDGRVSLAEAYAYAFRRTVASSAMSRAGAQHPSYEIDMRGFGEWTFARPALFGASIVVGGDVSGEVWIANRRQELVAELAKLPGERVQIGVKPGWYRLVHPDGRYADVADVNLAWGGEAEIGSDRFVRVQAQSAVLKGTDPIVLRPFRIAAGMAVGTPIISGASIAPLAEIGLERSFDAWSLRARAAGTLGGFEADGVHVQEQEIRFAPGFAYVLALGDWDLAIGAEARASYVHQTFARDDGGQAMRIFGTTDPPRAAWVFGGDAFVSLSVPITERLAIRGEIAGGASRVPTWDGSTRVPPFGELRLAATWSL
jgi:hypothetical protein